MTNLKRMVKARLSRTLWKVMLALVLVLLPIAALATTAAFSDGLVGWQAIGGSGSDTSVGGAYQLTGAAGVSGGHQSHSVGGGYTLNGGYVPVVLAVATPVPLGENMRWLPIISRPPTE